MYALARFMGSLQKLARNPSSINIVYKETGAYDFYALARTTCSLLKT